MKRSLIYFVILFTASSLFARDNSLQNKIEEILRSIPARTKYGVMIYNPVTRDTIFNRNITEPIKPASNVKLFTTGAAFAMLGGDYQLSTSLFTDDHNTSDGVINGNLYIKGFGNSLFTDRDIDSMVSQLQALGIRKITGKVIGDDSYFDDMYHRRDWIDDEETHDVLPPVSAIVVNRNRIQFNLEAAPKSGGRISFNVLPYCSLIRVKVNAKTTRSRTSISVQQIISSNSYDFVISGGIRRKSRIIWYSAEIKNPPLFAAYLLQDRMMRAGIAVSQKPARGVMPQQGSNEITSRSISLRDLTKIINKHSDNFLAECLFKTLGAYESHSQGNSFYATQAITKFLQQNSIYSEGTSIVDGSGLSRYNHATVGGIVNMLEKIYFDNKIFPDYYNSLSIAGVDGTLRSRMIGTEAENGFHGKTGTLNGVIALSGYLSLKGKPDLIVSIMFEFDRGSAHKFRFIEDRIVTALAEGSQAVEQEFHAEGGNRL